MTRDEYFDSAASGTRPSSDFEWYATDRNGHIASFTTAGFAIVPRKVFQSKEDYWRCVDYIRQLPTRCNYLRSMVENGDRSPWINEARRGLFAYDWTCNAGQYVAGEPYWLIASPELPLTLDEVPGEIRAWLEMVRFSSSDFEQAELLFPEREFSEVV
jgi:hypothetical protein